MPRFWIGLSAVALVGCAGAQLGGDMAPMTTEAEQVMEEDAMDAPAAAPPVLGSADGDGDDEGGAMRERSGELKKSKPSPRPKGMGRKADKSELASDEEAPETDDPNAPGGGRGEGEARTRAWFPESFLWQPLVLTDAEGVAVVDMTVPDQLTSWRILGLAHDRSGHQAGAVHSFDSRLPLYVDPVVPGWLYVGDQLELPVQVVNTTDAATDVRLVVEGTSALSGAGQVSMPIGASDSDVVTVRLSAGSAGNGLVRASIDAAAGADRAERAIPVLPEGRPVKRNRGGTLAGKRAFTMASPDGADPATEELTVQVYPGPLAVLQAEVERLQGGARPDDGAYGFALAAQMSALAQQTQVDVDPRVARGLQMVAWQRIVRSSRSANPGSAADLLASMGGAGGHELAEALRPRLVRVVVDGQRGDGTWARQNQGSLQQVLVQTAWAAKALPESEEGSRLRAKGALERYLPQVEDAYTAAVILGSGMADEGMKEGLRTLLLEAVHEGGDGERSVSVPPDVRNPWGYRPTQAEMIAWTALALADQEQLDWRFDLVAGLMSDYSARWGFGAGPADVVALEAISVGLPGLSAPVEVVLSVGGEDVGRAKLDPAQPKVPATLIAAVGGRGGEVGLRAEPAVPGLAFVATLESWVPWTGDESLPGVDVEAELSPLTVGRTGLLSLTISAPSGESLTVEHGLPAGTVVDEAALTALSGQLTRSEVSTDRVRLTTRAFQAGEIMTLQIPVQPAFGGQFTTPPLTVSGRGGQTVNLPPQTWSVRGAAGS